jgi:hypothetical protein
VSLLAFVYLSLPRLVIKAGVIRWADISRERLAIVATASAHRPRSVSRLRLWLPRSLAFSLAIVLEFPLGSMALRRFGRSARHCTNDQQRLSASTRPQRRVEFRRGRSCATLADV